MVSFNAIKAIFSYFAARKRRWLLPIVIFLVLIGALMVAGTTSIFAPFIYTLF